MAILLYREGRSEDACALYERSLQAMQETLGADHLTTLRTQDNLASVKSECGKLAEAKELYKKALSGYTRVLGWPLSTTVYLSCATSTPRVAAF